jgi:glycogen(starch) synthase
VSRFERDRFAGVLGVERGRFDVIPNGSDLPAQAGAADGAEPPNAAEAPDAGDPLLVSLGRLERYKGHQRVLAALPAIVERRPGARLRIAGAGPYEQELRDLAAGLGLADRVDIGPVPRDQLGSLLDRADLVLLLSEYEAHPVAVMEALARRRRVLVADTSGLSELAAQELVRAIDVDSAPAAVADAVVAELDRAAPSTTPHVPTWDETVDALEAIYRRVVSV